MTMALEGGEGSASRLGRSLPPEKTRYSLYRRLGRPQDQSGQVRKISHPPGFDLQTVQPVASRYTDYATRPTKCLGAFAKLRKQTVSFVMFVWLSVRLSVCLSVRPSVRMEQLASNWVNLYEI
jgi:hypothetical protein